MPTLKNRSKFYSFIAYKENGDIDKIRAYIKKMHYSAAISPLHSPESDDDEIDLKQHYHVVLQFPNPRVCDSVRDEFNAVANIAMPQRVGDIRAMTRYLTHMDNLEKEQFNTSPEVFGNFSYDKYIYKSPDPSDDCYNMIDVIALLHSIVASHVSFSDLLLAASEKPELMTFILRNSYTINIVVNDFNRSHK